MSALWLTVALALLVSGGVAATLRDAHREAARGWRLLAYGAGPLALAGLLFVVRFWVPTGGPYLANVRYPFGTHLAAWAVSFGFTWVAFALVFAALALVGGRSAAPPGDARVVWAALLGAWLLCWLPHAVIGVAFAWAGQNAPSVAFYRRWASDPVGAAVLFADAALLLSHLGLSVAGFYAVGRGLRGAGGGGGGGAGRHRRPLS